MPLLFSFYYDLNDDVLIRDILAGRYTGQPESHNIQTLFPFSAFVSALYRLLPTFDWYGAILLFLQGLAIVLVLIRILSMGRPVGKRLITAGAVLLAGAALLLPHLVFLQYSMTVGMLASCVVFLLLTGKSTGNDVLVTVLVGIAYLLRSEMLLLLSPFIALAVLFRYLRYEEENTFRTTGIRGLTRYGLLIVAMAVIVAAGTIADKAAYSSPEWSSFVRFFNARTQLYDFERIPPYEGNEALYEGLGLEKEEQVLLENYNFGLDVDINADTLYALANASAVQRKEAGDTVFSRLKEALKGSLYRIRNFRFPKGYHYPMSDAPYNLLLIGAYVTAIIMLKGSRLWWQKLILTRACGLSLMLFLLVSERDPVRITHGVFLAELMMLAGIILVSDTEEKTGYRRRAAIAAPIVTAVIAAVYLPSQIKVTGDELSVRAATNAAYEALYSHCEANPDLSYYIDVYASVGYSKAVFADRGTGRVNYDITGGWACFSPLYTARLKADGFDNAFDALMDENARFVTEQGEGTAWLTDYYRLKGREIELTEDTRIGTAFVIYRVIPGPG